MKTIEVPDEMYAKLIELATEMTEQDPRGTRMPHIFQIETTEECAAYPGNGRAIWVDCEGNELDEAKRKEAVINAKNWDILSESLANENFDELDGYDIETILEREANCRRIDVETRKVYQNCFFTSKACKQYIAVNGYHYTQPRAYLNHAWRNPEMELVATFLCNLVGKPMHT